MHYLVCGGVKVKPYSVITEIKKSHAFGVGLFLFNYSGEITQLRLLFS